MKYRNGVRLAVFDPVEQVAEIKEIAAIYEINDKQGAKLDAAIEEIVNDIYIETSSLEHIKRWEKMLDIYSLDTDSLEDRRIRVKTKVNETLPYTIRVLKRKLNALCGDNGYTMTIDRSNKKIIVAIALDRKAEIDTANALIEEMMPLDYVLGVELMYNTWNDIANITWEEAASYTWEQIREKAL